MNLFDKHLIPYIASFIDGKKPFIQQTKRERELWKRECDRKEKRERERRERKKKNISLSPSNSDLSLSEIPDSWEDLTEEK